MTLPCYILYCILYARRQGDVLIRQRQIHDYFTRCAEDLRAPRPILTKTQHFFLYMSHKLYNRLPSDLRDSTMSVTTLLMSF